MKNAPMMFLAYRSITSVKTLGELITELGKGLGSSGSIFLKTEFTQSELVKSMFAMTMNEAEPLLLCTEITWQHLDDSTHMKTGQIVTQYIVPDILSSKIYIYCNDISRVTRRTRVGKASFALVHPIH